MPDKYNEPKRRGRPPAAAAVAAPRTFDEQAFAEHKEGQERARQAMEEAPLQTQDQKSAMPLTDHDKMAEEARASRGDSDFDREHSKEITEKKEEEQRQRADAGLLGDPSEVQRDQKKGVKAQSADDWADQQKWFPVFLKNGYVPIKGYKVREGDSVVVKMADAGATLDKVQRGQRIELPIDEAKKAIAAGVAERADEVG